MKLLLTGGTGQVGWQLQRTLATLGRVEAPSRLDLDLADPDAIASAMRSSSPDVVVNAAAHTAVDRAEEERDAAGAVNARAPAILAEEAARAGAVLVHFSTDYVFDGTKPGPYDEEDAPAPINVYGRTKLEGEEAIRGSAAHHLILRTSWVYGLRRDSFVTTMLDLFRERKEVSVVDDQTGSPTWCRYLAEATAQILARHLDLGRDAPLGGRSGTYHLAGSGRTTWHGLALAVRRELERRDADVELRVREIRPVPSSEFPRPAPRPRNSQLSSEKAREVLGIHEVPWERQLSLCLEELAD